MTTTFTVTGRVADASAGREVRGRVLALLRELGAEEVRWSDEQTTPLDGGGASFTTTITEEAPVP